MIGTGLRRERSPYLADRGVSAAGLVCRDPFHHPSFSFMNSESAPRPMNDPVVPRTLEVPGGEIAYEEGDGVDRLYSFTKESRTDACGIASSRSWRATIAWYVTIYEVRGFNARDFEVFSRPRPGGPA